MASREEQLSRFCDGLPPARRSSSQGWAYGRAACPIGEPRRPGLAKGRLTEAFFEPLPEDELAAWQQ